MSERVTVGDLVVSFLERCNVELVFGIISIHNLPIADAIARRNSVRFVPTRNEAGAVNMADSAARFTGTIGVAMTSTGAGVGNACASLVEAAAAGVPLLHLTGNVDLRYIDRITGYTHETPQQAKLIEGASKAAFRIVSPDTALGILREAVRVAYSAPMGPVTIEIPIDVQKMELDLPANLDPIMPAPLAPSQADVDAVADMLVKSKRPMLWLGGGAREAIDACARLVKAGVGIVSSAQGRGTVPDDHPQSLSSFSSQKPSVDFYKTCDFMMVVGSKLRSAQTHNFNMPLPRPLVILDADPQADNRSYKADRFVCADAKLFLDALADKVEGKLNIDPNFHADIAAARKASERILRDTLGPYEKLADAVIETVPADFNWVRDITMNNSTWGNRLPAIRSPRRTAYAASGGIGMGLAQAIGAAIAAPERKTVSLIGDGGFSLSMGEFATAVQENVDMTIILMNDGGYGIMRNLQDSHYEGRRFAADLVMPDFGLFAKAFGVPHRKVTSADDFVPALKEMLPVKGPTVIEVDMAAVGPFAQPFHGPLARPAQA